MCSAHEDDRCIIITIRGFGPNQRLKLTGPALRWLPVSRSLQPARQLSRSAGPHQHRTAINHKSTARSTRCPRSIPYPARPIVFAQRMSLGTAVTPTFDSSERVVCCRHDQASCLRRNVHSKFLPRTANRTGRRCSAGVDSLVVGRYPREI